MPKCTIKILPLAWQDIDRIAALYLKMVGPDSAQRITDKLLDTIAMLEDFPLAGAKHPDPVLARQDYRKVICDDYVCVYKVIDDTVFLYRVVNGKIDYPRLLQK